MSHSSHVAYFDELSADDDSDDASSSSSDDDSDDDEEPALQLVLHADVDCFYCQCEQVDHPDIGDRPFAIGQKHIIVTCNYSARKLGVGKLMAREEAYQRCPHLLIVEGSDLERYRVHSQAIYESFRNACKELFPESCVAKGSMDEMMAGIRIPETKEKGNDCLLESDDRIYVYGEGPSEQIQMVEDQTGASTTFLSSARHGAKRARTPHQQATRQRLLKAAHVALRVRQRVLSETGFTITMGLSTNPLIAKIAGGLKKPAFVNVLEPGSSCEALLSEMPLRKINGVGRSTMKSLLPCLERNHGKRSKDSSPWTCGDLLQVPKMDAKQCLGQSKVTGSIPDADMIYDLCRGRDARVVVDDDGGLQKTLSVENTFRRGTVTTRNQVMVHMQDICQRLPRLFNNRTSWSSNPTAAYPSILRLTVRLVDTSLEGQKRRPFTTTSAQKPFDGSALLKNKDDLSKQSELLREAISPLLQKLIFSQREVNVTRVNIALCGFLDVPQAAAGNANKKQMLIPGSKDGKRRRIDDFFSPSTKRTP